jgi:hypothetical protein
MIKKPLKDHQKMPKLNMIANIIDKVADNVDRFTLDKEEKATLIAEINKAQLEVNKVEAGSTSRFVSGWRPFIGWVCGIALCYHFVLQPVLVFLFYSFGHPMDLPVFNMETLTTILMGMLGLSTLRSAEKIKRSA